MPYATKQQQAVLDCLQARSDEPLSAAEIAAALRLAGQPVGLATVYRQLEKLEEKGSIHKVNTEEGAYFQYCGRSSGARDCLLLKCQKCGRILHLDCTHLQSLHDHLHQEHHFSVDFRRTLLTGLCARCAGEDEHGGE